MKFKQTRTLPKNNEETAVDWFMNKIIPFIDEYQNHLFTEFYHLAKEIELKQKCMKCLMQKDAFYFCEKHQTEYQNFLKNKLNEQKDK